MKKIIYKACLFLSIPLMISIAGCYSELNDLEIGDLQWSPELGLPLIDSEFTLIQILEASPDDFNVSTDDNNTVVISIIDDSIFSQSATDFYFLLDQSLDTITLTLTQDEINDFNSNGSVTVNGNFQLEYPENTGKTAIEIYEGIVDLEIEENFPPGVGVSINSLIMEDPENNPILNFEGDVTTSIEQSFPFNDIGFIFDGALSQRQVRISVNYTIQRTSGFPILVFEENQINMFNEFVDQEFDVMYGDLASGDIGTNENSIDTDFLNQDGALGGIEYFLEDPQFKIIFKNTMGTQIRFDMDKFTSFKDGQATDRPINTSIPVEASNQGSAASSEADFDGIFKNVINNLPESVTLTIGGALNPDNDNDNFVTRDSYIQAGYQIDIPLELSLSGLEINQTVALDGIDPQELQYALFKFSSENSLPFDLNFKADLLDADSAVVMNLFDGAFLAGGSVAQPNSTGQIIRLEDNPETDSNELEDLNNVTRVGINATVSTSNGGNTVERINADATVKFNLAIQAKYNIGL
jgi:hypothetical protein